METKEKSSLLMALLGFTTVIMLTILLPYVLGKITLSNITFESTWFMKYFILYSVGFLECFLFYFLVMLPIKDKK